MANSSKTRTIDEIDDPFELMDVMKAFDIAAKGLKTVDEMKTRLIDVLNLAEKMPNWSAGQVRISVMPVGFYFNSKALGISDSMLFLPLYTTDCL